MKKLIVILFVSIILLLSQNLWAGTTGKITGVVIDSETREPLPGVMIIILGTAMGTNTDIDGRYTIINVPMGTYSVQAKMMGYKSRIKEKVKVLQNEMTILNIKLKIEIIDTKQRHWGQNKVKYDQTQTIHIIQAEEIEHTPKK